jgi:hypothetical protein
VGGFILPFHLLFTLASISEIGPYGKFKQSLLNSALFIAGVRARTKDISFS